MQEFFKALKHLNRYDALVIALISAAMLIAFLLSTRSEAAGTSATVEWSLPECYNDGAPATPPATGCGTQSPLPASDIASVTVKWSGTVNGNVVLTGAPISAVVPIPCGGVSFVVFVTTKLTAKFPSASSADSNSAMYATGVSCRPNPPTAVTAR